MSYLDKAKRVVSALEAEHGAPQDAKEANKAKEPSSTAQTITTPLRNKYPLPQPEEVSAVPLPVLVPRQPDMLPPLPWQLERLLSAAASDVLPQGMTHLESGLVFDLQKFVLTGAAAYLTGDRDEALKRLWQAHRAWQGGSN